MSEDKTTVTVTTPNLPDEEPRGQPVELKSSAVPYLIVCLVITALGFVGAFTFKDLLWLRISVATIVLGVVGMCVVGTVGGKK